MMLLKGNNVGELLYLQREFEQHLMVQSPLEVVQNLLSCILVKTRKEITEMSRLSSCGNSFILQE